MDEEELADFAVAMLGEIPVEAWVDDDGYVRRIGYELDMGADVRRRSATPPRGPARRCRRSTMGSSLDFTDYGDPGIEVEFPDEADTVDVTDAFAAIVQGG